MNNQEQSSAVLLSLLKMHCRFQTRRASSHFNIVYTEETMKHILIDLKDNCCYLKSGPYFLVLAVVATDCVQNVNDFPHHPAWHSSFSSLGAQFSNTHILGKNKLTTLWSASTQVVAESQQEIHQNWQWNTRIICSSHNNTINCRCNRSTK